MSPAGRVVRRLIWTCRLWEGREIFELRERPDGWLLRGDLDVTMKGEPLRVRYTVRTGRGWETREATIDLERPEGRRSLRLEADPANGWTLDGRAAADLAGCVDVDLSFTPATNTLPIRRIGLREGERAETVAAWVRFPGLEVRPLRQSYQRIAKDRYVYQSDNGPDTYEITVDDLGAVLRYSDIWKLQEDR